MPPRRHARTSSRRRPASAAWATPARASRPPRTPSASPVRSRPVTIEHVDTHADRYGNAFLLTAAPDHRLPAAGMPATDAMRLLGEELVLDGIPMRNLAT